MKLIVLKLIRFYQKFISPALADNCRHYPSCSQYAHEAIEKHGLRGSGLAIKRILKCNQFFPGGFDPVP